MTPVRWSEDDRAKAVAFHNYQKAVCHRCGVAPWEDADRYNADRDRCYVCEKIDRASEQVAHSPGKKHGVFIRYGTIDPPQR